MAWKGFYKESVSFIAPRGFKQWLKFYVYFPIALYNFYYPHRVAWHYIKKLIP